MPFTTFFTQSTPSSVDSARAQKPLNPEAEPWHSSSVVASPTRSMTTLVVDSVNFEAATEVMDHTDDPIADESGIFNNRSLSPSPEDGMSDESNKAEPDANVVYGRYKPPHEFRGQSPSSRSPDTEFVEPESLSSVPTVEILPSSLTPGYQPPHVRKQLGLPYVDGPNSSDSPPPSRSQSPSKRVLSSVPEQEERKKVKLGSQSSLDPVDLSPRSEAFPFGEDEHPLEHGNTADGESVTDDEKSLPESPLTLPPASAIPLPATPISIDDSLVDQARLNIHRQLDQLSISPGWSDGAAPDATVDYEQEPELPAADLPVADIPPTEPTAASGPVAANEYEHSTAFIDNIIKGAGDYLCLPTGMEGQVDRDAAIARILQGLLLQVKLAQTKTAASNEATLGSDQINAPTTSVSFLDQGLQEQLDSSCPEVHQSGGHPRLFSSDAAHSTAAGSQELPTSSSPEPGWDSNVTFTMTFDRSNGRSSMIQDILRIPQQMEAAFSNCQVAPTLRSLSHNGDMLRAEWTLSAADLADSSSLALSSS